MRVLLTNLLLVSIFLSGGCSGLPEDIHREVTYAWPSPGSTKATKFFSQAAPVGDSEKSGIRLISDPSEAFRARYNLSAMAERTLDFQYYLWKGDATGSLLLERALEAADRGVRVRILIDDIYHKGRDHLYAKISAHPNASVRVFNPRTQRGFWRSFEMLFRMHTLNHRMHNKIFLVDNSVAVLGGRNIGDDYFGTDPKLNFQDLDAIVVGPIAAKAGQAFDTYWNSARSVRVEALYDQGIRPAELEALKQYLESTHDAHINALSYSLSTESKPSMDTLMGLRSELIWADADIVVDDLERFEKSRESDIFELLKQLTKEMEEEILIQTAYLIPTDETIQGFKRLVDRGIRVRIMTNSLMSNNHVSVHGHYKKYRKALLEAGVELYELRADDALLQYLRDQSVEIAESNAGLHTKSFVIDGKIAVISSYNMDPRSRVWNSEIALVIRNEIVGAQVQTLMEEAMSPENAYQVVIDADEDLQWVLDLPEGTITYDKDPDSTWTKRFLANLISWMPIGNQL